MFSSSWSYLVLLVLYSRYEYPVYRVTVLVAVSSGSGVGKHAGGKEGLALFPRSGRLHLSHSPASPDPPIPSPGQLPNQCTLVGYPRDYSVCISRCPRVRSKVPALTHLLWSPSGVIIHTTHYYIYLYYIITYMLQP